MLRRTQNQWCDAIFPIVMKNVKSHGSMLGGDILPPSLGAGPFAVAASATPDALIPPRRGRWIGGGAETGAGPPLTQALSGWSMIDDFVADCSSAGIGTSPEPEPTLWSPHLKV